VLVDRHPEQADFATQLARNPKRRAKTKCIRGERRHDHSLRSARDLGFERGFSVPLQVRTAVDFRAGRVAQQEANTLASDLFQAGPVEMLTLTRIGFDLEIPGVHDGPHRGI